MENKKKVALIILDGWGYGRNDASNAILAANTPFFDSLIKQYPNSKLEASGTAVGLPAGQMGNSEVGHMNLGAGRVVYQELGRIHKAVDDNEFRTMADDHVRKMNRLKTVENIPKNFKSYKQKQIIILILPDKQNNSYDNDHRVLEYTYRQ